MASHRRHLKRHSMPTSWPVQRKLITFTTRPNPGSMKREYVLALVVLLRDVLKVVHTTKEAKYVVNNGLITVNSKVAKDIKMPVGIFDCVEIKKTGQKISVVFDTYGKVKVIETSQTTRLVKVSNKTLIKGGKYQVNGQNGVNVVVDEKGAKKIETNSTVLIDSKQNISKVLPLEEKSKVYIVGGKYVGLFGEVTSIIKYNGVAPDKVTVKTQDGEHTTALKYCFVVDEFKGRVE